MRWGDGRNKHDKPLKLTLKLTVTHTDTHTHTHTHAHAHTHNENRENKNEARKAVEENSSGTAELSWTSFGRSINAAMYSSEFQCSGFSLPDLP